MIPGTFKQKSTTPPLQLSHWVEKVIGLDNVFNVDRLLRHRLGHTTQRLVMFGVQREASSSIISKPLISPKTLTSSERRKRKIAAKLDKHAQTSSSGFAKEYTRFQFIVQCFPGQE